MFPVKARFALLLATSPYHLAKSGNIPATNNHRVVSNQYQSAAGYFFGGPSFFLSLATSASKTLATKLISYSSDSEVHVIKDECQRNNETPKESFEKFIGHTFLKPEVVRQSPIKMQYGESRNVIN